MIEVSYQGGRALVHTHDDGNVSEDNAESTGC
jgi:hypothetical protein